MSARIMSKTIHNTLDLRNRMEGVTRRALQLPSPRVHGAPGTPRDVHP